MKKDLVDRLESEARRYSELVAVMSGCDSHDEIPPSKLVDSRVLESLLEESKAASSELDFKSRSSIGAHLSEFNSFLWSERKAAQNEAAELGIDASKEQLARVMFRSAVRKHDRTAAVLNDLARMIRGA